MEEGQENKAFADNKKDEKGGVKLFNKLKLQPTPKVALIRATPMSETMIKNHRQDHQTAASIIQQSLLESALMNPYTLGHEAFFLQT